MEVGICDIGGGQTRIWVRHDYGRQTNINGGSFIDVDTTTCGAMDGQISYPYAYFYATAYIQVDGGAIGPIVENAGVNNLGESPTAFPGCVGPYIQLTDTDNDACNDDWVYFDVM